MRGSHLYNSHTLDRAKAVMSDHIMMTDASFDYRIVEKQLSEKIRVEYSAQTDSYKYE
jgi:hypothetical protein